DVKAAHRRLHDFNDEDLKLISILPEGSRLEQNATYFDLKHPERGEFTASGREEARADQWIVPKSAVDFNLWNRLIGIKNPERLGDGVGRGRAGTPGAGSGGQSTR